MSEISVDLSLITEQPGPNFFGKNFEIKFKHH